MKQKREHPEPFIELLLNSELNPESLLQAFILNPAAITHPKAQALMTMLMADVGVRSFEEVNELAEKVYKIPCHVDLQICFLSGWCEALLALKQVPRDQLKAIEEELNALISDSTPAELKAIARFVQAHKSGYFADYASQREFYLQILDGLSLDTSIYQKFVVLQSWCFLGTGMGSLCVKPIEELDVSPFDRVGVAIAQLSNEALTARLNKVEELVTLIASSPNDRFFKLHSATLEVACTLIYMICQTREIDLPSPHLVQMGNQQRSWAVSTNALLSRKPMEALHWARIFATDDIYKDRVPLDFVDHTLVRAELACGNGGSAKRLLLQLREKGTETYIDDFYFARAELLLGNRHEAAAHFAKLRESLDRFEAKNRLDFEIQMSCELSSVDIVDLTAESVRVSSKDIVPPLASYAKPKGIESIISSSSIMTEVKDLILNFASHELPVLITGETGTGKELVARALHDSSIRSSAPFIAVNCSAVTDSLIQSEFFGHAVGAFTGAISTYKGILREAGEGTVFLDEIADISPQLQVALLRVIETGEVRPVGSSSNYPIKCRIVTATNKDLRILVAEGGFRSDLYYRLQRLEIQLPMLREHQEDIPVLVEYFFNTERIKKDKVTVSSELMDKFKHYSWPGNIRELRNVIQRMRILSSDKACYDVGDLNRCNCPLMDQEQVDSEFSEESIGESAPEANNSLRRKEKLRSLFEDRQTMLISEAAKLLGVTHKTAARYMKALAKEGVIERVTPNASPGTHYYTLRKNH